ncbi:glutaredoxin family protein [Frankia sp. Cppng1_Ct_nod]|uniref:glutaredoxin family protein n=1 Tax=Frankia sp. Cppng1_Ct_nod TaxID=2897162 RepID=UPI0010414D4C|nr:glutaredoxin family protein [Frankia sp. Cppng1_Ct_nod]
MTDTPTSAIPAPAVRTVTVTLLTQADCTLCDHAKAVLARVARDHPLTVEEVTLDSDAGRTLAAQAGMLFAPGVLVDGAPFSYGRLSERRLRRTLARLPPSPARSARPSGPAGS